MTQIEPGDQAEQIDLDALDPAELHGSKTGEIELDAGATVGAAGIEAGAEIAADRIGRQRDAQLGHRAQHRSGKAVAVRPRPDAVVAGVVEAVGVARGFDARISFSASGPEMSAIATG